MTNKIIKVLVLLPGLLFIVTGIRWLLTPGAVAPMFGLTLDQGVGLSSQVGDMSAFFLTLGSCMLLGLASGRHSWFYPAIMLLALTAVGRVFSWLVHDAALALDLIAPEVIVSAILLVAIRYLPEQK